MIYDRILQEKNRIENEISLIEEKLKSFPPGNLFFVQNGNYDKWFQSNGHSQNYIPKKNRPLAEQLAIKKYLSLLLKEYMHEKYSLEQYLNCRQHTPPSAANLLSDNSKYKEFLIPYFSPLSEELTNWQNASFQTNPKHPEQLTQPTASGILVRSKSEALIDIVLYKNRIPFRYECALPLGNNRIFYPDFTILHPHSRKKYYWEHFGLMDVPSYSSKAFSKLQTYAEYGIIPGENLIVTYETKNTPLDPEYVENLVNYYFL